LKSTEERYEVVYKDEGEFEQGSLLSIGLATGVQVIVGKRKGTKSGTENT